MLYTPHFLAGAAILKLFPDPKIGLPLAFLSHIFLDLTPHNDFDLRPGVSLKEFLTKNPKRKLILTVLSFDIILMTIFFLLIWFTQKNYWYLLGGVVGISPDAIEQVLMILGLKLPGWQDKLQWRVSAKYGFISYPIVSLIALLLLLR